MRSFKLFAYKNESYRILITEYDSTRSLSVHSLYSTFDEQINFSEHDQITLTFSLMKYIDDAVYSSQTNKNTAHRTENLYHKLLHFGQTIELLLDNKDKYIFIISDIKPILTKNNVQFQYTCQDQVSYQWSRRNLGLSYSTIEEGGVQTIYTIATNVLRKANISDWRVDADESNEADENFLSDRKITLEVFDSNPYNIIIEACNALNAFMKINYTLRKITFYQRDKVRFSGYRYRPELNLRNLDAEYNINEMATIMHVYGGTDENGQIVSITPTVPDPIMQWWCSSIGFGQLIDPEDIQWAYDIIIDEQIPHKYTNAGVEQDRIWSEDYFVAYSYTLNHRNILVPTLYRTYLDVYKDPFYLDAFLYMGRYNFNGIIYDRWQKYESSVPTQYYALTAVVVGDDKLIKPELDRINFQSIIGRSYDKDFIYTTDIKPVVDNIDHLIRQQFAVDKYYIGDEFNISIQSDDPQVDYLIEFINLESSHTFVYHFQEVPNDKTNFKLDAAKFELPQGHYAIYIYEIDNHLIQGASISSIVSTDMLAVKQWMQYADKCPALGNFLYNFDFFEHNGLLTTDDKSAILHTLESNMAYNNMWLKYYEPIYWRMYSALYLYIQEAKTILENLQLARINQQAEDIDNLANRYQIKMTQISKLLYTMYDNSILLAEFNNITTENYQLFSSDVDILQNLVNEYKMYLDQLTECNAKRYAIAQQYEEDYKDRLANAEKEYYTSTYYTLLSLVGSGWGKYTYNVKLNDKGKEEALDQDYMATYPKLIMDIYNALDPTRSRTNSIYREMRNYTTANDILWTNLYQKYSQFLYEGKYENQDELDSMSLFNQAQIYYEDYNKPNADYSIGVIDICALEAIDTARLAVGSKIKVYNSDLNLNEGELDNIQFTNNDLIVTGINYELRRPENISVSVEKISSYQSILQKLIKSIN